MRKIVISLALILLLLLGVRAYLGYWYFMQGVYSFDAIMRPTPSSDSTMIQELETIEQDFEMSNRIKSTIAATKNQAYIAELLRTLKIKKKMRVHLQTMNQLRRIQNQTTHPEQELHSHFLVVAALQKFLP
jgi:hypothetical protein